MKPTGGVLLLLLGGWSLAVGSCSVLGGGGQGPRLTDGLIALGGLLCLAAAPAYFLNRGRMFALLAPLAAVVAEVLSLVLFQPSWIGLTKIALLLLAFLTGLGIGRAPTKDLPAGA
jgi:hypothetical protein